MWIEIVEQEVIDKSPVLGASHMKLPFQDEIYMSSSLRDSKECNDPVFLLIPIYL